MLYQRDFIIIHHTGAEEENAEAVRQHHLSRGWRDVGYNYIIERDGAVVPGRSLLIPGAHTKAAHMNFHSIGIALIGNFEEHPPARDQAKALIDLITGLRRQYQIATANILLHREVPGARTLCPGKYFPKEEVFADLTAGARPPASRNDPAGLYRVQVGAFADRERAEDFARRLRDMGMDAFVTGG